MLGAVEQACEAAAIELDRLQRPTTFADPQATQHRRAPGIKASMKLNRVEWEAFQEANRLGHHWVGPEHGLLAILRGEPHDPARRALEEAGMDAQMVERLLAEMAGAAPSRPGDSSPGALPNPAWYTVTERAEGFAASLGTGEALATHFVLAMLWAADRWMLAERRGVRREAVIDALRRLGVVLPPAPLPELYRLNLTQQVEFPRSKLEQVLATLAERHPPGSGPTYGFNHDGAERAWAVGEDGIDLQGIVDEALAEEDTT